MAAIVTFEQELLLLTIVLFYAVPAQATCRSQLERGAILLVIVASRRKFFHAPLVEISRCVALLSEHIGQAGSIRLHREGWLIEAQADFFLDCVTFAVGQIRR